MEELFIDGIELDRSQGRITLHGLQDKPGAAANLFREIGRGDIVVDMIVQSHLESGEGAISFTVPAGDYEKAMGTVSKLAAEATRDVGGNPKAAKLSVSGIGLRSHTGVAIRMFKALSEAKINVAMINTSEVRVNVIVDGEQADKALACLKDAFGLQ